MENSSFPRCGVSLVRLPLCGEYRNGVHAQANSALRIPKCGWYLFLLGWAHLALHTQSCSWLVLSMWSFKALRVTGFGLPLGAVEVEASLHSLPTNFEPKTYKHLLSIQFYRDPSFLKDDRYYNVNLLMDSMRIPFHLTVTIIFTRTCIFFLSVSSWEFVLDTW